MEPFTVHEGIAAPLMRANIDTDAIIPSREMKRVSKTGLGEGLFAGWRYLEEGGRELNPDFVLNKPGYAGVSILLAGPNFGCGSSREHAVWALAEFGIRAIIAPSFGGIFENNCMRNVLLPVTLPQQSIDEIVGWIQEQPNPHMLVVNLLEQRVECGPDVFEFTIESEARRMLVAGLDAIDVTLEQWPRISAFHEAWKSRYKWLY